MGDGNMGLISKLFGFLIVIIGLVVMGYALVTSMSYVDTLSSTVSMAGYSNIYTDDAKLQMLLSMAWPGLVFGVIIVGIGLLLAK